VTDQIRQQMLDAGYRDVTVTIVSGTDPYKFDVRFKTTFKSAVGSKEAAERTSIQILPGMLPAIVSTQNRSPSDLLTFRVNTDTTNAQGQPTVGVDDVGNFVIAWGSGGQELSYFNDIRAQWYNRDGEAFGQEVNVNNADTSVHFDPYVALSHDGNAVIAWTSTDTPTVTIGGSLVGTVNAKGYASDGQVLLPQFNVGGVAGASVAFDRDNNFYISRHRNAGGQNITGLAASDVFAVGYRLDGTVLRPEFRVNSGSIDTAVNSLWPLWQYSSQIVSDADGDLVIDFEGFGPDVATAGFGYTMMDSTYFQAALADPANADLAALFPFGISFYNYLDIDANIEDILIDAYNAGATSEQLGRLRKLLDDQLGLLRGDPNAVMTTRLDAAVGDPLNILYSDNVSNAERSGHNKRYIITVSTDTTGGNFVLRLYHPNLPGREDLTITAPITGGSLNVGNLREAIEDALQGAQRTGVNWEYTGSDPNNTVSVRILQWGFGSTDYEIARRQGTPWELPFVLPTDAVFEVVFQGEVHDTEMYLYLQDNNLNAQNLSEVQNLYFFSTTPGYFALQVGTTGPTIDIYFDPAAPGFPATVAQQIENALVGLGFAGLTVTPLPGGPPYIFQVVFGGPSAGVDQPPIQQVPISNPLLPQYPPGSIYTIEVQQGGGNDAPSPDVVPYTYADDGILQTASSIAIEPDGDFVMAWTQYEEYTFASTSNQNIYYRRFVESTDTAGPQVTDVFVHKGMHVDQDDLVDSPVTHLVLTFDENMMATGLDAVTNPANYILRRDGVEIPGGIAAVQFGMNRAADLYGTADPLTGTLYDVSRVPSNKWEAIFTLDSNGDDPGIGPLEPGLYTIEAIPAADPTATTPAVNGLRDRAGNPLGYNGYNLAGAGFARSFVVPVPQRGDTPVPTPPAVNARTFPESNQAVAMDADGDHVIVWTAYDTTIGRDRVFARIYDASGAPAAMLPFAFQVTPTADFPAFAADSQRFATVAADKDGDFIVTWTNYRGSEQDIYARRYSASGTALSDPFLVNTFTLGEQRLSSVALDTDGDFVITWSSYGQESFTSGQPGLGFGVYARLFDSFGQPRGSEFLVNQTTLGNQRDSAVAMDSAGGFVVAWVSNQGGSDDVYVRRFAANGAASTAETLANTTLAGTQNFPDVAVDLAGQNYVVTWTSSSNQDGDGLGVFARAFGATPTGEFQVNTSTLGDQQHSSVAMNHLGNLVVTWGGLGNQPFQEDLDQSGVFYQRYLIDPATGVTPSGGEIRANAKIEGAQRWASVDSDGEGNFATVWTGDDGLGSTNVYRFLSTDRLPVTDVIGPIVTDVLLADRTRVFDGDVLTPTPPGLSQMIVLFGEQLSILDGTTGLDSVLNPANWILRRNGSDVIGGIQSVNFTLNPSTRKYEAVLNLDGNGINPGTTPLPPGQYTLIARDKITDGINRLDGDFDGVPGSSATGPSPEGYAIDFVILAGGDDDGTDSPVTGGQGGRTDLQTRGAVAADADGDHVVAWTAFDSTLGRDRVYARLFDADGAAADTQPLAFQVTPLADFPQFIGDDQRYATVASDGDGDLIVTWTNYRDGDADIYARRYRADGTPLSDPFLVNTYGVVGSSTESPQKWSSVAMDPHGNFVITWSSLGQEDDGQMGLGYGVYARRFDTFGNSLGGEFQVNLTTAGNQQLSAVDMDSYGGFVIVWQSDQNGPGDDIIARVYYPDGSPHIGPLQGEILVNDVLTDGNQQYPDVAVSPAGDDVVFTWTSSSQDSSGTAVMGQRINIPLLEQGQVVQTITYQSQDSFPRSFGFNNTVVSNLTVPVGFPNEFTMADVNAQVDIRHGFTNEVTVYLISPAGTVIVLVANEGPFPSSDFINTTFDDEAAISITDPTATGPFLGSYRPEGLLAGLGQGLDAFDGQLSSGTWQLIVQDNVPLDSGTLLGWNISLTRTPARSGEFQVNTSTAGNQGFSSVAMNHQGAFTVTWSGSGDQLSHEDSSGVFYQRFAFSGNRIGAETRANIQTEGVQTAPSIASDGEGNVVIVWTGPEFDQLGNAVAGTEEVYRFLSGDPIPVLDVDGPWVTDMLGPDGNRIFDGDWLLPVGAGVKNLTVVFGEDLNVTDGATGLNSILNLENFILEREGVEIPFAVTGLSFWRNPITRKYEATLTLDGNGTAGGSPGLPAGDYVLVVRDAIRDVAGNALDGDFDGLLEVAFAVQ